MPASGVRHRPLKRMSTEGTFLSKKILKKGGGNVYDRAMDVGLGRQLQDARINSR